MAGPRKRFLWALIVTLLVAGGLLAIMAAGVLLEARPDAPEDSTAGPPPRVAAVADGGGVEQPADDDAAPEPAPAYSLVGTVVASDKRWSRASIASAGGKAELYRIGDLLPGQARLVRIGSDRVVIEHEGRESILRIEDRVPDREAGEDGPESSDSAPELEGVERIDEGRYRIDRSAIQARLDQADELLRDARVSLVFGDDGAVVGVRLGLERSGTVLERVGFRDGDLLLRIGSLIIDSPQKLEGLADLLGSTRDVDVELNRDGRIETLRYWIVDR